jgi:hypothetical protein
MGLLIPGIKIGTSTKLHGALDEVDEQDGQTAAVRAHTRSDRFH